MICDKNHEQTGWSRSGGEMGALIRAYDWAATPLGAVENWPPALRSTVEMLTVHGFPMVVLWGPNLIQIYNDGYRIIMGNKHPTGLGQPTAACWPEVWHINEPIYKRVWAGETVTFEDALYPITRHGPLEDAWFTLTYSPLRDDDGAIAGVLVTVFETTERYLSDKRRNESEALLRIALEGGGMGAWRWDLKRGLIWGDTQFLALWGLAPSNDPHPLTLFTDRLSPEGADEIDVIVNKALKGARNSTHSWRSFPGRPPDGGYAGGGALI